MHVVDAGVQLVCSHNMWPDGVNDNRLTVDAPFSEGVLRDALLWHPKSELPPINRELLLWVHSPFVGHWDAVEGAWVDKTSRVHLGPIQFWAYITPP
jgi:hypothetical protein